MARGRRAGRGRRVASGRHAGVCGPRAGTVSRRLAGSGNGDAVCVVSYGNRAYEDALSELVGLTRRAGFRVVAAGAFVTEHSLNGRIAAGRPDEADTALMEAFGRPGRRQAARPGRMRSSDPGPGTRALQGLRSDSAGSGARSGALRALRPLRAGVSRADDRSGKLSRDRPPRGVSLVSPACVTAVPERDRWPSPRGPLSSGKWKRSARLAKRGASPRHFCDRAVCGRPRTFRADRFSRTVGDGSPA